MDAPRVQQVIIHLLTNAIKFSPNGGKVKVTLNFETPSSETIITPHNGNNSELESSYVGVNISVIDSGIGISEQQQKVLFEPSPKKKDIKGN